jgi:hypothetical protein
MALDSPRYPFNLTASAIRFLSIRSIRKKVVVTM